LFHYPGDTSIRLLVSPAVDAVQADLFRFAFLHHGQAVAVDNGNHAAGREAGRAGVSGTTSAIA
jgi:hypothetical protein